MRVRLCWAWVLLSFLWATAPAGAAADPEELKNGLLQLKYAGRWGELHLEGGAVRAVQVDSLYGDSVAVSEVVGPLYEHRAVYKLTHIESLRDLGPHRIPLSSGPPGPHRSLVTALVLETILPGGGYFYVGQSGMGWKLLGVAAAAAGTAVATGKEGAAGWAPMLVWIKLATFLQLREEVAAVNAAGGSLGAALVPQPAGLVAQVRYSF